MRVSTQTSHICRPITAIATRSKATQIGRLCVRALEPGVPGLLAHIGGSARITGIGHRLRPVSRSSPAPGSTTGTAATVAAQLAYRLSQRSVPDWNDAEAVPLLAGRGRNGRMGR